MMIATTEKKIDINQVKRSLVKIVEKYPYKKNPYSDKTRYGSQPIHFTENRGLPSCLVGHILVDLFPDVLPQARESLFGQSIPRFVFSDRRKGWSSFSPDAIKFLLDIQELGDSGQRWDKIKKVCVG